VSVDLARRKLWRGLQITAQDQHHLDRIRQHLARYGEDIADFQYQEAA
jgi:hypothetical protein